jgi:hypothetical protein
LIGHILATSEKIPPATIGGDIGRVRQASGFDQKTFGHAAILEFDRSYTER